MESVTDNMASTVADMISRVESMVLVVEGLIVTARSVPEARTTTVSMTTSVNVEIND